MKNDINYTQAIEELENIVNQIENDDITVDQLSEKVKQAALLIKICQDALKTTGQEVKEILSTLNQDRIED